MWVIFRDPRTLFNHLDKYVVAVVADEDISVYQRELAQSTNGTIYEVYDAFFLQPFVKSDTAGDFFARKYKTWTSSPN